MAEEIQEEIEVQGPGAMLKARRESLQLSIEEIAEKLHLRPAVVAELEDDVIDHSVSMTFTKGYVRLYARHLEMDPAPVLAAFDEMANPIKQPARLQSFSQRVARQASDTRLMILSYFILFVIIAMAVIWWFQQPEESIQETATALPATTQSVAEQSASQPELVTSTDIKAVAEPDSQLSAVTSAVEPVVEQTNLFSEPVGEQTSTSEAALSYDTKVIGEALDEGHTGESQNAIAKEVGNLVESNDVARKLVAETESEFDVAAPDSEFNGSFADNTRLDNAAADAAEFPENFGSAEPITQQLVFTFEQDCWMNLTDATGENIAYGVKNAGRVMPVSGIPPFEVVLGAPQGVAITVDGVSFDMSALPAGRTARFTIGSQSESGESPE